jgi:predicted transglutaminase-like cysteine proteinase
MIEPALRSANTHLRRIVVGVTALILVSMVTRHASAADAVRLDINDLFGLPTVMVPEGQWWSTWRDLRSQMQSEKRIIDECRAEPEFCTSTAALRFNALVKEGEQYEGLVRIGRINRAVNFSITAANQPTWTSPLTALTAGVGDCKQYAILKYAVLEAAGFATDDLRLVVVRVKSLRADHAVVAVRHAGKWLVLDNRTLAVVESSKLLDFYVPLFTLDDRSMTQFVLPPATKIAGLPQ